MGRHDLIWHVAAAGALAVTLAATATGCQAGPSSSHRDEMVTGTLVSVGGPAPGSPVPLPGHVTAIGRDGDRVRTVTVSKSGKFTMRLAAGTYRFTGTSPRIDSGHLACRATHRIHVLGTLPVSGVEVECSIR
jgi:hypothetical protein